MKRWLPTAIFGAVLAFTFGDVALAGAKTRTTITVRSGPISVTGSPVEVPVKVSDAEGRPVPGALLRLVVPVQFMGKPRNEIVGEATSDDAGEATIRFAPAQTGDIQAAVMFWGDHRYAASEATITFQVERAAITYRAKPTGLQAGWARSYLILVPFVSVWATYLAVWWLGLSVKRAGFSTRDVESSRRRKDDK